MTRTIIYLESGNIENHKNFNKILVLNQKVAQMIPIDWSLKELAFHMQCFCLLQSTKNNVYDKIIL